MKFFLHSYPRNEQQMKLFYIKKQNATRKANHRRNGGLQKEHNIEKYGDCYCNVTFIQWIRVQLYTIILDKKLIKPLI